MPSKKILCYCGAGQFEEKIMRISSKLITTLFLLLSLTNLATAQSSKTEHTYMLDDPALAALQVEAFRLSAMSFPIGSGLGGANVSPRAVARLSIELLSWLCILFTATKRLGHRPALMQIVLVALIPKPDGRGRPIMFFPGEKLQPLGRTATRCHSFLEDWVWARRKRHCRLASDPRRQHATT